MMSRLSIVLTCGVAGYAVTSCKEPPPPPEPLAHSGGVQTAAQQQPESKQQLLAYVPTYLAMRPGCETPKVRLLDTRPAGLGKGEALDDKAPPLMSYFEATCVDEVCYGEYRYGQGNSRIAHVCSANPSSCKDSDPAACARVAWDFPLEQSPGEWRAKYLGKACDGGERSACLEAANHETFRSDYPGKKTRLEQLYGRGCILGDQIACDFWGAQTKASAYSWSNSAKLALAGNPPASVRVGTVAIPKAADISPRHLAIKVTWGLDGVVSNNLAKWVVDARCGFAARRLWLTGEVSKTSEPNTKLWMLPMASAAPTMIGPPCELHFKAAMITAGATTNMIGHGCWTKGKLTPGRCAPSTWSGDATSVSGTGAAPGTSAAPGASVTNMRFAYESRRPVGPNISDQYWYDLVLGYAVALGRALPATAAPANAVPTNTNRKLGAAGQYRVRGHCGAGAQRVEIEQSFSIASGAIGSSEMIDGQVRQKMRRRAAQCSFEWVTRRDEHVFHRACYQNGKLKDGACL